MSTVARTGPLPGGPGGPGGGRRRRSPGGWVLVALGAVVAVVLVAATAANLLGLALRTSSEGGEVVRGVSSVRVSTDCAGDVELEGTGGSAAAGAVRVRWQDSGVLRRPVHRQRLDGDELVVEVDCPVLQLGGGPTSDLALAVPAGATVAVEAGSGDVRASGLRGATTLVTGSGDVEVDGVVGDLRARTGSGSVLAEEVGGAVVEVSTGSGDVHLATTAPPRALTARTGSGDVRVELPDDARGYAVETDTGAGEVQVGVRDDPRSSRTVALRTGSGDITVEPAG